MKAKKGAKAGSPQTYRSPYDDISPHAWKFDDMGNKVKIKKSMNFKAAAEKKAQFLKTNSRDVKMMYGGMAKKK